MPIAPPKLHIGSRARQNYRPVLHHCIAIWSESSQVLHCSTCSVHSIQIKRRIVSRLDKASREFPTTLTPPIPPTHPIVSLTFKLLFGSTSFFCRQTIILSKVLYLKGFFQARLWHFTMSHVSALQQPFDTGRLWKMEIYFFPVSSWIRTLSCWTWRICTSDGNRLGQDSLIRGRHHLPVSRQIVDGILIDFNNRSNSTLDKIAR